MKKSGLCFLILVLAITAFGSFAADEARLLFDGQSFAGWEGNLDWFRIEESAIVAGTMDKPIKHNEFLCTTEAFQDFDLTLEVKLSGKDANAGIQFRTARIANHFEVSGYQADMGQDYWGCLYDESRRNKVLARPDAAVLKRALKPEDWNTYRIRCEGPHIQLWLNGVKTVDYEEAEEGIARSGVIAVQIHGGGPSEARYRNLRLTPLGSGK